MSLARRLVPFVAVFLLVPLSTPWAQRIIDPPHDVLEGFVESCDACHGPHVVGLTKDEICLNCHGEEPSLIAATVAATHGSDNTLSTRFEYAIRCADCHNPHDQEQNDRWGTDYGKFIIYRLWKTFTATDLTVTPPETFSKTPFAFLRFTNELEFDNNDGNPNNDVCNSCHTRTNHHQSDNTAPGGQAHFDGTNCTACHSHSKGFAASIDAETHPKPDPLTNSDCSICHADPETSELNLFSLHLSNCSTCHTGTDFSTTLLGPIGTWNGRCAECHTDPQASHFPVASQHPQAVTNCAPCHTDPTTGVQEIVGIHADDCARCHLSATETVQGPNGTWNQECTACHVDPNASHFPVTGQHAQATPQCAACHADAVTATSEIVDIHVDDCARCHLAGGGDRPRAAWHLEPDLHSLSQRGQRALPHRVTLTGRDRLFAVPRQPRDRLPGDGVASPL